MNKAKIEDFTRWILSDKYIAKKYAYLNGFKIPKTYQLVKYPHHIKLKNICVIKPTDLCDGKGVYLIKNGINLKTKKKVNINSIINNLQKIRSEIFDEYYMYDKMYNGLIPFTGYIVEELLLDENNNIPSDYKCYTFNGRIYYIAVTYNRRIVNNKQLFDSIWFDRDWKPIYFSMIKENYKYVDNLKKPKGFSKLIKLVENVSHKLKRHCRIDIYLIKENVYLGEFTFFTGAKLHTNYCNFLLGNLWKKYPDDYNYQDNTLKTIIPKFYNLP